MLINSKWLADSVEPNDDCFSLIHLRNKLVMLEKSLKIKLAMKISFRYLNYAVFKCFCGRVPWLYQYWPGGFMLFVGLCPGTPEGSTGSGSGF